MGQNRTRYFTCSCLLSAPGESRFQEIRRTNQAAAKRLVEKQVSSSSSDEDNDDDGERGRVLESTFTCYTSQTGEVRGHLALAQHGPINTRLFSSIFYIIHLFYLCVYMNIKLSFIVPQFGFNGSKYLDTEVEMEKSYIHLE